MIGTQRIVTGLLLTLAGWLAAQCVLLLSQQPQPVQAVQQIEMPLPGLLVGHWQAPVDDGVIPLTRLPLYYLGAQGPASVGQRGGAAPR